MLAAAGCLTLAMGTFISCNNDDDNDNGNNTNADLVGTYRMTSWNAPSAVDYDQNGTSSSNMMSESNCFNDSQMTINQDGTYMMTYNDINIANNAATCRTTTTNGTWTRQGNSFTTTSGTGASAVNTNYTFAGANVTSGTSATMTRYWNNGQYATFNTATGFPEYATGNVNMVYTMQ